MAYRMESGFGGGIPPMVRQLILINAIIFLVTTLLDNQTQATVIRLFGLVPGLAVLKGMVWQFATYMFLHGGLMHLVFNMFGLWIFGSDLERWWGSRAFLKYYMITGIGAGLINAIAAFMYGGAGAPTIGASGSIFGIILAYAMAFPQRQILLWFLFPISARAFAILYGVMTLFTAIQNPVGGGVAHFAHLGGMVVGFLYLKHETLLRKYRQWTGSRAATQRRRESPDDSRVEQERSETMNRILDKISREGMSALSAEERKFLAEAGERARRRQQGQ